jgi:hypothetical protein
VKPRIIVAQHVLKFVHDFLDTACHQLRAAMLAGDAATIDFMKEWVEPTWATDADDDANLLRHDLVRFVNMRFLCVIQSAPADSYGIGMSLAPDSEMNFLLSQTCLRLHLCRRSYKCAVQAHELVMAGGVTGPCCAKLACRNYLVKAGFRRVHDALLATFTAIGSTYLLSSIGASLPLLLLLPLTPTLLTLLLRLSLRLRPCVAVASHVLCLQTQA